MRAALIAGCGYVGAAAARLFADAGWSVTGWTRTEASARALADRAITARPVNLANLDDVQRRKIAPEVVVHCASSGGGGEESYREVYLAGAQNLVRTFPGARLIFISSTSVYAQDDGSEVTEESVADPITVTGKILREAEENVLAAGGSVLRVAGIYGPGRSFLLRSLLEGKAALAPRERLGNQIHRDDIARAIFALAQCEAIAPPRIFNVVDDRPSPPNEVLRWLSEKTGRPLAETPPASRPRKRGESNKRVSNTKLRALGWIPEYPSYVEAFTRSILPELPVAGA